MSGNWWASSGAPAPSAMLQYNDAVSVNNLLTFSVVESEEWDEDAEVTEHPVEVGGNVADHVRVSLVKCTLKVFNSNEPIRKSVQLGNYSYQPNRAALTLPIPVPTWTSQPLTLTYPTWDNPIMARALLQGAGGLVGGAVGGATGNLVGAAAGGILGGLVLAAKEVDVTQQTTAGLQPTDRIPPTFDVDQWAAVTDYVHEMHMLLVDLKNAAQQFTVLGSKRTLSPMVIESLSFSRTNHTGSGEEVTIGLKEVRIVSTKTVPLPVPNLPAGGGAPPASHGQQDPTPVAPVEAESVLSQALSALRGLAGGAAAVPPVAP